MHGRRWLLWEPGALDGAEETSLLVQDAQIAGTAISSVFRRHPCVTGELGARPDFHTNGECPGALDHVPPALFRTVSVFSH